MQKERDLELAALIGQSLLKQNQEVTARNEMLDEQLEAAKEEVRANLPEIRHPCLIDLRLRLCVYVWSHVVFPRVPDRSAAPRALDARRPPAVLRRRRGDGERRVAVTVGSRAHEIFRFTKTKEY